jgi:hypothetical protein
MPPSRFELALVFLVDIRSAIATILRSKCPAMACLPIAEKRLAAGLTFVYWVKPCLSVRDYLKTCFVTRSSEKPRGKAAGGKGPEACL